MEWDLQFVAIIVTVLLAIGGGFWRIIATMKAMEKGCADAKEGRREIKEEMNRRFDADESDEGSAGLGGGHSAGPGSASSS